MSAHITGARGPIYLPCYERPSLVTNLATYGGTRESFGGEDVGVRFQYGGVREMLKGSSKMKESDPVHLVRFLIAVFGYSVLRLGLLISRIASVRSVKPLRAY